MSNITRVAGHCVLTMRDGSQRRISNQTVLALYHDVSQALGRDPWPVPDAIYERFPILKEFRDAKSVLSEGDDDLCGLLLNLVKGPATTPLSSETAEGGHA